MAFRTDTGSLRPAKRLANGQLRLDGALTRTGVFTYRRADGSTMREYRPPEAVFDDASLETFDSVTVTNDHPPRLLTPADAAKHAVGMLQGAPRRDGDHVVATMVVYDAAAIADIEAGKRELSCGYECDVELKSGVSPQGERYDAIQTNIRGNHVAVVHSGRAGSTARLRLDADDAIQISQERIDMDEKVLQALKEAHEAKIATLTAERDAATARADAAESKLKELQTKLDANDGSFDTRVNERVALVEQAKPILGDAFKQDMTDDQLRVECVKKLDGGNDITDKGSVYIRAYFDAQMKSNAAARAATGAARIVANGPKTDNLPPGEAAYQEMVKRNTSAGAAN